MARPIVTSWSRCLAPTNGSRESPSYVRSSFGNSGGMVTPADVARVRAETEARKAPWTIAELEASLPRPLDSQQLKLTASHAAENHGERQRFVDGTPARHKLRACGFPSSCRNRRSSPKCNSIRRAKCAEAAAGAEVQRSAAAGRSSWPDSITRGWRASSWFRPSGTSGPGGRAGFGGGGTPVVGYPRGYTVEVSADGKTWGKSVAQGKGDGARTTITFAPTRAKFLRITQTETVADAPAWSIRNLRIYEAPANTGTR